MKKIVIIMLAGLSLTACVQKAKATNKDVLNNSTSTPSGIATPTATIETDLDISDSTPTQTPVVEVETYEVTAPADEVERVEGENEQIAYKKGDFENLYAELVEKYSSGYQSFDKESLLDLYGDGETDFFDDGIGYVSQEDGCANELFVFIGLEDGKDSQFVKNIINPIADDSTVSDSIKYETYDYEDVTVVCIGDQEFLNSTRKMVETLFSGENNG